MTAQARWHRRTTALIGLVLNAARLVVGRPGGGADSGTLAAREGGEAWRGDLR